MRRAAHARSGVWRRATIVTGGATLDRALETLKASRVTRVLERFARASHAARRSPRAQEKRRQKAEEGKQKLADREADYKQREKDLKDMKKNTKAKVDDDVYVHAPGGWCGGHAPASARGRGNKHIWEGKGSGVTLPGSPGQPRPFEAER